MELFTDGLGPESREAEKKRSRERKRDELEVRMDSMSTSGLVVRERCFYLRTLGLQCAQVQDGERVQLLLVQGWQQE